MICPSCGYKRKPEDKVPNWQCPNCQVAYNKVAPDRVLPEPPKKNHPKPIVAYIKQFFSWCFYKSRLLFSALWKMMGHTYVYWHKQHHKQNTLLCQQCGNEMFKTTYSSGNFVGIVGALIVFLLGIVILVAFFVTIIGPIIGILLILMSLGMGGKRQKIWKCRKCGYFFPRL